MCHFIIVRVNHWEFIVYNIKPDFSRCKTNDTHRDTQNMFSAVMFCVSQVMYVSAIKISNQIKIPFMAINSSKS